MWCRWYKVLLSLLFPPLSLCFSFLPVPHLLLFLPLSLLSPPRSPSSLALPRSIDRNFDSSPSPHLHPSSLSISRVWLEARSRMLTRLGSASASAFPPPLPPPPLPPSAPSAASKRSDELAVRGGGTACQTFVVLFLPAFLPLPSHAPEQPHMCSQAAQRAESSRGQPTEAAKAQVFFEHHATRGCGLKRNRCVPGLDSAVNLCATGCQMLAE